MPFLSPLPGPGPAMVRSMAHSPPVAQIYQTIQARLAEGVLPASVRELLAVVVAEENRCAYCFRAHTTKGRQAGLSFEVIDAGRRAESTDPKVKVLLEFAREVIQTRGQNRAITLPSLKEAGWSDPEVTEAIAVVALNVFPNYFNHLNGTDPDFPEFEP